MASSDAAARHRTIHNTSHNSGLESVFFDVLLGSFFPSLHASSYAFRTSVPLWAVRCVISIFNDFYKDSFTSFQTPHSLWISIVLSKDRGAAREAETPTRSCDAPDGLEDQLLPEYAVSLFIITDGLLYLVAYRLKAFGPLGEARAGSLRCDIAPTKVRGRYNTKQPFGVQQERYCRLGHGV